MDRCPAQDERQDMLGRGRLTKPLEGGGGREVPIRGCPAQEGSCWQTRQCSVWPPARLTWQQPDATLRVWRAA